MLPGLGSERPTLLGDAFVHSRDLQLDLDSRLGQLGDLLPERVALHLRPLDAQEQVTPIRVRPGHRGNLGTLQRVTGQPHNSRTLPWPLHLEPSSLCRPGRPIRSRLAEDRIAGGVRDPTGSETHRSVIVHVWIYTPPGSSGIQRSAPDLDRSGQRVILRTRAGVESTCKDEVSPIRSVSAVAPKAKRPGWNRGRLREGLVRRVPLCVKSWDVLEMPRQPSSSG